MGVKFVLSDDFDQLAILALGAGGKDAPAGSLGTKGGGISPA